MREERAWTAWWCEEEGEEIKLVEVGGGEEREWDDCWGRRRGRDVCVTCGRDLKNRQEIILNTHY